MNKLHEFLYWLDNGGLPADIFIGCMIVCAICVLFLHNITEVRK